MKKKGSNGRNRFKKRNLGRSRQAFPMEMEPEGWNPDWNSPHSSAEEYLRRVHYKSEYLCDDICYDKSKNDDMDISNTSFEPQKIVPPPTAENILSSKEKICVEKFEQLRILVNNEKKKREGEKLNEMLHQPIDQEKPTFHFHSNRSKKEEKKKSSRNRNKSLNFSYYSTKFPSFDQIFEMDYVSQQRLIVNLVNWIIDPPSMNNSNEEEEEDKNNILDSKRKLYIWLFWILSLFDVHLPSKVASQLNDLVDYLRSKVERIEEGEMIMIISSKVFNQKGSPGIPSFLQRNL